MSILNNEFSFDNLHTNLNRGEIKQGTIGYAADDLEWLVDAVKTGNPIKRKFAYLEKDGDMHPFCVVNADQQISLANKLDYMNFAYFYELPIDESYVPLDLHNPEDVKLLMSQPITRDCRIRNVLGIDTDTETCFIVQDDECPHDKTIAYLEPKELLSSWTFLDGSVIGRIKDVVKFDESRLYGANHEGLNDLTCGYCIDDVEHFKKYPEVYILQDVQLTMDSTAPYYDGVASHPFFYKSAECIHRFE